MILYGLQAFGLNPHINSILRKMGAQDGPALSSLAGRKQLGRWAILATLEIIAWSIVLGLTFSSLWLGLGTMCAAATIIGIHSTYPNHSIRPSRWWAIYSLVTGIYIGITAGVQLNIGLGIAVGLGVFVAFLLLLPFTIRGVGHLLGTIFNLCIDIYEGICILISNTYALLNSAYKGNGQKGESTADCANNTDPQLRRAAPNTLDTTATTAAPSRPPTKDDFFNHLKIKNTALHQNLNKAIQKYAEEQRDPKFDIHYSPGFWKSLQKDNTDLNGDLTTSVKKYAKAQGICNLQEKMPWNLYVRAVSVAALD